MCAMLYTLITQTNNTTSQDELAAIIGEFPEWEQENARVIARYQGTAAACNYLADISE